MAEIHNIISNVHSFSPDMVYSFGGDSPEQIYQHICSVVNDSEYIALNKGLTVTSISFFDSVVFRIRINSKTQCLDTENAIAAEYAPDIHGASLSKNIVHIPLITTKESLSTIRNMLLDIYDNRRSQVSGEKFGCCNDHIRCSDAGHCLHLDNKDYWGCCYRKNLEAGRIFYGKNKNYVLELPSKKEPAKDRYVVFDVETPNSANDRISAIGIVVLEGNRPVHEFYSLVNPETHFDAINIKITGITSSMISDKPTFPEIWSNIREIMNSGLLVAHNAAFDMSVLAKTLHAYNIEWLPYVYYTCTCTIGRKYGIDAPNFRLNTLCDIYGIPLEHHNALSDAKACASLLAIYLSKSINPTDYLSNYDMLKQHTAKESHSRKLTQETQQLLTLKDLLKDISADGILNLVEISMLQDWLEKNDNLKGQFPFDKVFEIVEDSMEDGQLDSVELQTMLSLFEKITDPLAHTCCCEKISINGKTFCLTGDFDHGSRTEIEALLIEQGGIPSKSVTKKTDYLIVGNRGSEQWSSGNYGNKVKKAMELQEKGCHIQIVKEIDAI